MMVKSVTCNFLGAYFLFPPTKFPTTNLPINTIFLLFFLNLQIAIYCNIQHHNIMIIPIRAPTTGDATEKVEWIMLELNGELLKPLVEEKRRTATGLPTKSSGVIDEVDIKRRVELGSVKFDSDVSTI